MRKESLDLEFEQCEIADIRRTGLICDEKFVANLLSPCRGPGEVQERARG
jgi:hypothetical protein